MSPLQLFYSPGACSLAAHVALEEAGADFEAIRTVILDGATRTPEYLALNPQGRVPVLARDGEVLTELGAILDYLNRAYPHARLMPQDPWQASQAISLMGYLSSNLHIAFAQLWRPERFVEEAEQRAMLAAQAKPRLLEHLARVESRLPQAGWVGGERPCVADFNLLPFYRFTWRAGLDATAYPRYTALITAASERPAVQRALEREGLGPGGLFPGGCRTLSAIPYET